LIYGLPFCPLYLVRRILHGIRHLDNGQEVEPVAIYYRDQTVTFPIDSVFKIKDPDSYECHVEAYDARLSHLVIRTRKLGKAALGETPPYFEFNNVMYFEGSMTWIGANFCVAPPTDCLQVAHKMAYHSGVPDNDLLGQYDLFVVNTQQLQIGM
jgi:hypothetical protein